MNDNLPPSLNRFAAELERAIRRELAPRRDRRLSRALLARPRLLAGTTIGAAGAGTVLALVLSAVGTSPAFAVTAHHDGTYDVTLRSLTAIPAANRKLSQVGVPARLVQVGPGCNVAKVPPGWSRDVRIDPRNVRRGRTLVIAAWHNGRQVKISSSMRGAAAPCIPPCPPVGGGQKRLPGNFHNVGGSGNSGNSGNSGSGSSGTGGNSGSSGDSGGRTVRTAGPRGQTAVPATVTCPGPPPRGAGNSRNSGNSGSGNS